MQNYISFTTISCQEPCSLNPSCHMFVSLWHFKFRNELATQCAELSFEKNSSVCINENALLVDFSRKDSSYCSSTFKQEH